MVNCFSAGIAVYLCHTRSAVHELHELLTTQNDESTEMKRCIAACNAVLCYVRSGQHACGVLGLLAIDRSQEHLRLCIDAWRGIRKLNSAGDTIYSIAGLCYANATNRYIQGDTEIQEMWTFAAHCADTIIQLECDQLHVVPNPGSRKDVPLSQKERTLLIAEAVDMDAKQKTALESGKAWSARFFRRAAYLRRLAVVNERICDLLHSGQRSLPPDTWMTGCVLKHQCITMKPALTLIEDHKIVFDVADRPHCAAVKQLAERAAQRLWEAVDVLTAKPTEGPDPVLGYRDHMHDSKEDKKQRRAEILAQNASCLAELVATLSPVMTQLETMCAEDPTLKTVAFVSLIAERLLAAITASAENDTAEAVHVRDLHRLVSEIAYPAALLRAAQRTVPSSEVHNLQRYGVEACKVCRETSPAHIVLSDCWLTAATHVQLATQRRAQLRCESDTLSIYNHTVCARVCEKLATGLFRDAAQYSVRAERTTCRHARNLWQKAIKLLLQSGATRMESADVVATLFDDPALESETPLEMAQSRCAYACTAAAVAVEGAGEANVVNAVALSPLPPAGETGADYDAIALKMRLLLVRIEHTALARTSNYHSAGSTASRMVDSLRSVVGEVWVLSNTCRMVAPSYAADHPLHMPSASVEPSLQREQLLRWLCDTAVECYKQYKDVVGDQKLPFSPTPSRERAELNVVCALHVMEGIQSFPINSDQYQHYAAVRTTEQLQRYQVLCKRFLAASRLALDDQLLPHALLVRATDMHLRSFSRSPTTSDAAVETAISNALVQRACQMLPASTDLFPMVLLLEVPSNDVVDANRVEERVTAHVQVATQKLALEETSEMAPREVALRNRAVMYYQFAAMANLSQLLRVNASFPARIIADRLHARAVQAAEWCDLAVQALHTGREDVVALYERAVRFVVITNGDYRYNEARATNEKVRQVYHAAGVRFAAAAQALAAEDQLLYQRWLRAAETTAELVVVLREGEGRHEFAATATDTAIEAADGLAAQAVDFQVAPEGPAQPRAAKATCCVVC
jgi:hypothetical protein